MMQFNRVSIPAHHCTIAYTIEHDPKSLTVAFLYRSVTLSDNLVNLLVDFTEVQLAQSLEMMSAYAFA